MSKIAVFYHCILSGGERDVKPDYSINLISAQMGALTRSGLADACHHLQIGVNGTESDAMAIACLCPDKSIITCHGKESRSEIPTLNLIRQWIPEHPDWYVLYHHTKGVSTPNQADNWRQRMELHMVWNWQKCVAELDRGSDVCGCHWLTPEKNPGVIDSPFFGGTFWWSKAKYLLTLPPLPESNWQNRYEAEKWIGRAARRPKVHDFCPGWPTP